MPKVRVNTVPPPPQPPSTVDSVTITLSYKEAAELMTIVGKGIGLVNGLFRELDSALRDCKPHWRDFGYKAKYGFDDFAQLLNTVKEGE